MAGLNWVRDDCNEPSPKCSACRGNSEPNVFRPASRRVSISPKAVIGVTLFERSKDIGQSTDLRGRRAAHPPLNWRGCRFVLRPSC